MIKQCNKCSFIVGRHMAETLELTPEAARALMLAAQGLLQPPAQPATKDDVLATIRCMGVLQIDSISIVARSPYLVLWSRLGHYDPRWLDELLAEGNLFEYWSHAASFLPIEEYALYRRRMLERQDRAQTWLGEHHQLAEHLLEHIREHGAVRSAGFARADGKSGTWWDWKPEKIALEYLFDTGALMVARRENFQRVYDLRERILPDWDDADMLSSEDAQRVHVLETVRALGVTPARWVADYFRIPKRGVPDVLRDLMRDGEVVEVAVEGLKGAAYVHRDNLELAKQAASGALIPTLTTLLSPFDPLVWDRARALELFGFHYRIEVYTPAPKRQFGYYTLPILHRGGLIGRLDPKAHRAEGVFEVRALHFEQGIVVTDEVIESLATTVRACAAWHGTPEVRVVQSHSQEIAEALQAQLR
jgi:uncharacterized protein